MRLFLLCFSIFLSLNTFAQHYSFGIDVPSVFINKFKPSAEFAFTKNLSVGLSYESGVFSEGTSGGINSQSLVYQVKGKVLTSELRVYPFAKKKRAPRGFSIGLYYRNGSFEEHYSGKDFSATQNGYYGPTTNKPPMIDIKTEGSTSNIGVAFAYKFNAGPIIFEPLIGFGSVSGDWDTPNERSRIDPFFKDNLDDFQYSGRIELKLGFYFPQMKNYIEKLDEDDVHSASLIEQRLMMEKLNQQRKLDSSKSIKLIAYRPSKYSGMIVNYSLNINDSAVMSVQNRSYKVIELAEAGEYKISGSTEDEKAITVNLEAGKIYYLRCTIGMGLFVGRPKFEFVESTIGEIEVMEIMKKKVEQP